MGFHELVSYNIRITDPVNIVTEILLFTLATLVLYKTGDWKAFFTSNKTNLVLIIPIATVLLPSTIGYPFNAPLLLTQPTFSIGTPVLPCAPQYRNLKNTLFYVSETISTFHQRIATKVEG